MLHERRLYMRTWGFNVNKNSALWKCFSRNTADTRCMRNTANFYIRNVMTGLRKSPEERTHAETEVLHEVFTGIQKANTLAVEVCGCLFMPETKTVFLSDPHELVPFL